MGAEGKGGDRGGNLRASFGHALRGLVEVTARERNMRIHVLAGVALGVFGGEVRLAPAPQLALLLSAALVLWAELGNSALESLVDLVTKEPRPEARGAKDAAAAAVLALAAGALLVAAAVVSSSLPEVRSALGRGHRLAAGAGVLSAAAWLLAPGRRLPALDLLAAAAGALHLVLLAPGAASPVFTALAASLLALAAAAARRARSEGRR